MSDSFQLESMETREGALRLEFRLMVRRLWDEHSAEKMTMVERRRLYRHNRPLLTYNQEWPYKVWRQEVRRILGLANGSLKKRTVDKNKVMPAMQQWCRDRGIKLKARDNERAPGALTLEGEPQAT